MACAWGGFAGYGVAMLVSYFVGQRYYPIKYPLKDIAYYVVLAAVFTAVFFWWHDRYPTWLVLCGNTWVLIFYVVSIEKRERIFVHLPVIGKYFK